jgi:uncharacterized membrane protein YheB (UPF0754 family)
MVTIIKLLFLIIIGGLIGWMTNLLALKMLFKPSRPKKILFFTLHGVIPKRQEIIADAVGDVVASDLVSISEIIDQLVTKEDIEAFKEDIKKMLYNISKEYTPALVQAAIQKPVQKIINIFVDSKGESLLQDFIKEIETKAENNLNIKEIVVNKIMEMDFTELEEIVYKIARKEFKHIEIIGAILGSFIGLIQGLLVLFL